MSGAGLMEGTQLARDLLRATAERAAEFERQTGGRPCLATVIVGDDPASVTYVRMKRNRCREAGIDSQYVPLPADTTTSALVEVITGLSRDPAVHGILLQHPVSPHIDERAAFEAISPGKDVDGVTMHSFAAVAFGLPGFASCTPGAIMRLLDAYDVSLSGMHAVVLGRSPILGKPAGMLLLARDATVTYCHSRTRDLPVIVRSADVVVAAVGRAELVKGDWLKPGAVVVDAGYNPGNVGDVAYAEALPRASLITPVPGGVGPMTIAVLLEQTVDAALQQTAAAALEQAGASREGSTRERGSVAPRVFPASTSRARLSGSAIRSTPMNPQPGSVPTPFATPGCQSSSLLPEATRAGRCARHR